MRHLEGSSGMTHDPGRAPPRPPSLPHDYDFAGYIGSGGMADVFLVRHRQLGDLRAMKVVATWLLHQAEFIRRFEREQQTAARLGQHPHIISVHHFARLPTGEPYAILPYYEHGSLASLGATPRTVSGHRALCGILAGVASALDCLANQRPAPYVHRDVKPGNVLVGEQGRIPYGVLSDFGLARALDDTSITRAGQRLLSPRYAAPEQFRAERLTPRTDVYALAVTACESLTGAHPFDADGPGSEVAHCHADPIVPEPTDDRLLPISQLIGRSLAKAAAERPSASDWEITLRRVERALAT
jgi:serine/threonine-protein kinase